MSDSVKETAYLCWAMVRVFDSDGRDLAEYQSGTLSQQPSCFFCSHFFLVFFLVDDTGVYKPYRLPQSTWSINRTIFSDPQDLMSSFDRITPQMITPFKTHPSFSQLKALLNKRKSIDVSSMSLSCGYLWGWMTNTLICADISVNIDTADG